MAVSPLGDVASGSFYAMDPSVIPWDLTNPIYKYVGVTLIVSNFNTTYLANTVGVSIPTVAPTLLPFKAILIVQGVQRNAQAIVSDVESVFGLPAGSFTTLASSPLTLPVSVFGADISPLSLYANYVNKFVARTGSKPVVISNYSASLLERSSSGIIFNSVESLTYPVSSIFNAASLGQALFSSEFDLAFGLNSTGVVVLQKNALDFSQAQDHTLSFGSLLGLTSGIRSNTNETFVTLLPGGAEVKSFSPSNMIIQSSPSLILLLEPLPWVGTAQRLLPDLSVTFHYPGFDAPVLKASWTTTPSTFDVGKNFTLTLSITNQGAMNAQKLYFTLTVQGALAWNQVYCIGNACSYSGNSVQYSLGSLAVGATDTRNFNFQSYAPIATFTLHADFLDSQNFAYQWDTQFSVAPNVKTNGPLTVTKSVTPASPAYGQIGNVTVTVNNPSGSTYYNMVDSTPEAIPFLYPNGVGNSAPQYTPCPYINTVQVNSTHFTFTVTEGCSSAPTVLRQVLVQLPSVPGMQLVDQPNIPLGPFESWSPSVPYRYPLGGPLPPFNTVTLQLLFQNLAPVQISTTYYGGNYPLPSGDASLSYQGVNCSPCQMVKGGTLTISGVVVNAAGQAIVGGTVDLSYRASGDNTPRPITSLVTDATGNYSYAWSGASQLAPGRYTLQANYTGSIQYKPQLEQLDIFVTTPTTIGPGATLTFSYPYFFNTTGPLTITAERIAYSSLGQLSLVNQPVLGEFVAQSSTVSVTVGAPTILPVVETSMNTTRLSFLYLAQNQSLVQVNLRVTNTGPQAASNVVVTSLVPRPFYSYPNLGFLPVVTAGPGGSVDNVLGVVSFTVGSLAPSAGASFWYVVKANSTNVFQTSSNVTAQDPSLEQFHFSYTGAYLGVYPNLSAPPAPQANGLLQTYVTLNPAVVANGTSTTLTLNLYNAGNVTYHSINATISTTYYMTFDKQFKTVPDIPPGSYQSVSFTVTAWGNVSFSSNPWTTVNFSGQVYYNQTSSKGWSSYFSGNLLIYSSKATGFNPSVKVDVSAPTPVSAGSLDTAIVTFTNVGTSNVTNPYLSLQAYSPVYNPLGPSTPQTSYGTNYASYPGSLAPGQSVKFRVGIRTTAGGLYPIFLWYANYRFSPPGSTQSTEYASVAASSAALVTATDSTGPVISTPWTSPFAPTSSDKVRLWTQVWDGSGLGSVSLEYSTDKTTWTTSTMMPLVGSQVNAQDALMAQSAFGDIFNTTLPATSPGTSVYYRVRATDRLGNSALQDNNGIDYLYTVLGPNSGLVQQPPGTNLPLDLSQYVSTLKVSLTLNLSTPLAIQFTQLSTNPAGSAPAGTVPLGVYLQINGNESILLDAQIRMYYTSSQLGNLNASTVTPYVWGGTSWVPLDSVVRNTGQNWSEGTVHHFSLFGLFASPPSPSPTPTPTPAAQLPWLIIGVVVAVVVLAVVGVLFYRSRGRRGQVGMTPPSPSPQPPTTAPGPQQSLKTG